MEALKTNLLFLIPIIANNKKIMIVFVSQDPNMSKEIKKKSRDPKIDKKLLIQDCILHKMEYDWVEKHINLKRQYHEGRLCL